MNPKTLIKAEAKRLGFSFCGFAPAQQTPHFSRFHQWTASEMAGGMDYLTHSHVIAARRTPASLVDNARSVMVLGLNFSNTEALEDISHRPHQLAGQIAAYACHTDYHAVLRMRCDALMQAIRDFFPRPIRHRIFIDSGPVMEKDFAFLAGLGWIGKNTLFIHPKYGSYCVLACVFLDYLLEAGEANQSDLCGDCSACLTACPTGCIQPDRTIDARACISYLTIEHKGIIPRELRVKMGAWVFGCDICQQVCPLNRDLTTPRKKSDPAFKRLIPAEVDLQTELLGTESEFQAKYKGTPVLRANNIGFLINLLIAAGNSHSAILLEQLSFILRTHHSPVIRAYAAWAIGENEASTSAQMLAQSLKQELDAQVRIEIEESLNELVK